MNTSAAVDPAASALPVRSCSSPLRPAACLRIQKIIHVTIPTATRAITVSSCSCSRWGRFSDAIRSPIPTPSARSTPRATPAHTHRMASRRPSCTRNAAMMPTMSAASSPSRRPITKVGNIRGSRDTRSGAPHPTSGNLT